MTAPIFEKPLPPSTDAWEGLDDETLVPTGKTAAQLKAEHKLTQIDFTQVEARVMAHMLSLGSGASTPENRNQIAMFKCDACNGSGRFIRGFNNPRDYGPCNKCKGTGKLKTDPETRAKQKKAREDAKSRRKGEFVTAHIPEATWVAANLRHFDFARSMEEALGKYGSWTDGQLAAIRKCMARDVEREKAHEATKAAAPVITGEGFDRMLATFARAQASGLRQPKLRVQPYTFSLAGERSKYAGKALFVKHEDGVYLGRIDLEGRWFRAGPCTDHDEARVIEICKDPLAAAIIHGKQTGRCACCGLELTNEESIRLGIGPICRNKWGL